MNSSRRLLSPCSRCPATASSILGCCVQNHYGMTSIYIDARRVAPLPGNAWPACALRGRIDRHETRHYMKIPCMPTLKAYRQKA